MKYNNKKYVIIFEVKGGTDKGEDGHRKDTFPILNGIKEQGFEGEVLFYEEEKKEELLEYVKNKAGVVISRINPGNLPSIDSYYDFLNKISKHNILVNTHPDVLININFKDILVKLKSLDICDKDSYFYHTLDELKANFEKNLKKDKIRVLKQNFGSTGEGVFLVELKDDGKIKVVEAVNNEKNEFENLEEFYNFIDRFFEEEKDDLVYFKRKVGFVDVKFLPRIKEGEIRVLLIGDEISLIVHKKPDDGNFSATLFSGAKYNSDSPENPKWEKIVKLVKDNLGEIEKFFNNQEFPLLWTMDFILDYDENKNDKYVLSEINSSCVGITTDLQLAPKIGEKLVKMLQK